MKGVLAELDGDTATAEQAYRRALGDPPVHAAGNNLAMLLLKGQSDVGESLRLAEAAVAAEPRNPAFLDTLALVLARAGQTDRALETIRRAVQLEPNQRQWQETEAKILDEAGRADEAATVRDRLRNRLGAAAP
jgi:Flp pilus assembly protein TadD